MSQKHTIEKMQEIARSHGGICKSTKYINNRTPLTWQCSNGHEWDAKPTSILRGSWCRKCYFQAGKRRKYSIADMRRIGQERGGDCCSQEFISVDKNLVWLCSHSHTWEATPSNIMKGTWCPHCSGRIVNINDVRQIAIFRGGALKSVEYTTAHDLLEWECKHGHSFKMSLSNAKAGKWCPECFNRKFDYWDILNLAIARRGKCHDERYISKTHRYRWECDNGHRWSATFYRANTLWCPHCSEKNIMN